MAEEFINRGGVCSGNRWNLSRNMLFRGCLSPCSGVAASMASFGWPAESNFCGLASPGNCDWTQGLLFDEGASNGIMTSNQSNPNNIVLETGLSDTSQIQRNWSPGLTGSFSGNLVEDQDSPRFSAFSTPINFPAQASENYSNHNISFSSTYPSTLNKSSLLDQPPNSVFENQPTAPAADYPTQLVPNYGLICSDDSSPASFAKLPSPLKPINSSLPNPPQPSQFQFSHKTPYWNASLSALDDIRASLLASPQSTLSGSSCDEKPIRSSKATKVSGSVEKKANQEPAFKRARIETPSPMPTFKVRKEKLGDRITTLQQLVSPFGKTDTASVLHEAIEYIKFLHDQVNVLTTPYTKNGAPFQDQQVSAEKLMKDAEGPNVDLKSRGLCLVPISSTFPVTSETPTDIWMPTFRGSFR